MGSLALRFPELVLEWHPRNELGATEAKPSSTQKVWWVCKLGHEWQAQINSRTYLKSKCPYCSGKKVSTLNSIESKYPELAKEWGPKNTKKASEVSFGSGKQFWWVCKLGHEWQEKPCLRASHNYGCPYCSGKRVSTLNSIESKYPELAKEWSPKNTKKASEVSFGSHELVWWVCDCGYEWEMSPNGRTNHGGRGCPACAGFVVTDKNSLAIVAPHLAQEWSLKNTTTFGSVSRGHGGTVWWVCKTGHEWQARCSDRIKGSGCPVCSAHTGLERRFENLLGTERWNKYIYPTRNELPYRPDIRLSDKIYANCDGLYWHSQKEQRYHLKMREDFESKGLRILQFYEDEVNNKPKIVKSMVDAVLGKTPNRIYARKCDVVDISSAESAFFLDTNHIIGRARRSRNLGLRLGGQLVQVMSVKMQNTTMEVIRSAGLLDCVVIGGFQRLLSACIKKWSPTAVKTLVDLRYADGHSLLQSGFVLDGINFNYQYTDGKIRADKRRFRVPAGVDERAHAAEQGWYRIYDAGKARYVKLL